MTQGQPAQQPPGTWELFLSRLRRCLQVQSSLSVQQNLPLVSVFNNSTCMYLLYLIVSAFYRGCPYQFNFQLYFFPSVISFAPMFQVLSVIPRLSNIRTQYFCHQFSFRFISLLFFTQWLLQKTYTSKIFIAIILAKNDQLFPMLHFSLPPPC